MREERRKCKSKLVKKEKLHKNEENLFNLTLRSGLGCPATGSNRSQHSNKSLSTKSHADCTYSDQLLSCLISSQGWLLVTLVHETQWHHQHEHWRSCPWHPCMVSAQNITVKADTHCNIYSHIQTELNDSKIENSPNLRAFVLNSTVHRLPESHQYSPNWSLQVRPNTSFSTMNFNFAVIYSVWMWE